MAGDYFDQISQKEIDWLKQRWACFTGSEIDRLTATGTRPMTAEELKARPKGDVKKTTGTFWGKTALTYIEEVATEAVSQFNTQGAFENRAMRNGKMNEPVSFAQLEHRLGTKKGLLVYHGGEDPMFAKYTHDSGVSPDVRAVKKDGSTSFGAELKNPDTKQHFYYLRKVRTQAQLKEERPDYYGQCQMAMMTFKCDLWLFVSFNENMLHFSDRLHIVEIKPDKPYQYNLDARIKLGSKEKDNLIKELEQTRLK